MYLMWFYYVYRHQLSTDTVFRPQMRRKINQICSSLLNFKHKIDDQGVKIVYYDLQIVLKLLKWRIASNSSKTTLMLILQKILNLVRRFPFFGRSANNLVKGLKSNLTDRRLRLISVQINNSKYFNIAHFDLWPTYNL